MKREHPTDTVLSSYHAVGLSGIVSVSHAYTYYPVIAKLAEPLEVVLVVHALFDKRGQDIARVHVQHHQRSQSHSVLFRQFPTHQSYYILNLSVVLIQISF